MRNTHFKSIGSNYSYNNNSGKGNEIGGFFSKQRSNGTKKTDFPFWFEYIEFIKIIKLLKYQNYQNIKIIW